MCRDRSRLFIEAAVRGDGKVGLNRTRTVVLESCKRSSTRRSGTGSGRHTLDMDEIDAAYGYQPFTWYTEAQSTPESVLVHFATSPLTRSLIRRSRSHEQLERLRLIVEAMLQPFRDPLTLEPGQPVDESVAISLVRAARRELVAAAADIHATSPELCAVMSQLLSAAQGVLAGIEQRQLWL